MINFQLFKIIKGRGAFTLVEMVMVLLIFGIGMTTFSLTLSSYWTATDTHVKRADIYQELNTIVEQTSFDGRFAQIIDVVDSRNTTFVDNTGTIIARYQITNSNEFHRIPNGAGPPIVLSRLIDSNQSAFIETGKGLILDIHMRDDTFGKVFNISTQTEIFPRNGINQL